ncbi:MAG: hypothetical protein IPO83_03250 [Chitinophagaceae bacterium]|nr:hypothetical protein [Chitinophagaceae bacterium]
MNLNIEHLSHRNPSNDYSQKDYHPGGMVMPDRNFSHENYRFGFENQEMDNEINGIGNSYTYEFRDYDSRIGRFKSIDPFEKQYPFYSPYHFAGNSPIAFIDLEGLEPSYFAKKNNSGETKLTLPVIGLFAELYGKQYWLAGAKANIKINQNLHDRITGYRSGAITLGFDINYTKDFEGESGVGWLLETSHEIVHVNQFIETFGKDYENESEYKEAVAGWMFSYGLDVAVKVAGSMSFDADILHDKIEIEKGANEKEYLFNNFFNAQYYKKEDGSYGNRVVDLLSQVEQAKHDENKKEYSAAYRSLINLAKDYKTNLEKDEEKK